MRGKEASRKLRGTLKGITPAYAGKSQCNSSCTAGKWDHPRVCGEKPRQDSVGALEGRITPACAGKRFDQRRQFVESEDHPRMCGEKGGVLRRAPQRPGSPPHVRGKVGLRLIAAQDDGITPACAGKSEPPGSGLGASGDHPRMCGEKTKPQRVAPPKLGSPPHVRGKVSQFVDGCACHGITPACAGKRGFRSNQPVYPRDHPRMCGEKTKKIP